MPLPIMPETVVAEAVLETIRSVDWLQYVAPRDPDLDEQIAQVVPTMRHWRGVDALPGEAPSILVQIDSSDPEESDSGAQYGVCGELRMILAITLRIDARLATNISAVDPTGLNDLVGYALVAMDALKDVESAAIYQVADNVADAGRGPDPDNTSDEGGLNQSITVLYRVRNDKPSVLLARGVNAL